MALDKQMELFDEGGLLQEGGSVDEESGNDVPVGSLKEEVRDDIPAQLSEGEFVMPADVVRFHGLDKMMALRDEAKTGLQRMDDMGQMGNSEEAVIPDGIPFGMDDLELEDEPMEMQVGGFVQPQTGMQYTTPSTFQNYTQTPVQPFQPQQPIYGQGVQGGYQPQFSGTQQPQQEFKAPTFDTLMPTYITYVNSETKAEIQVPVDASGNPLIPIPAGFVPKSSLPTEEKKKPETPTTVTQAPVAQQDTGGDSDEPDTPAGLTRSQSQVAALTQLDPRFAGTIEGINKKYPDPGIGGLLSPISTVINSFKKSNEISQAVKGYDYDALAKNRGLTTDALKGTLDTFGSEIYSGYRNAETGEVSGQKDMRSLGQIASEFISPKTYDDIDEFGNIAEDGTVPESTRVKTARVTGDTDVSAVDVLPDELSGVTMDGGIKSTADRIADTANALMARGLSSSDALRAAETAVQTGKIDADVAAMFGKPEAALVDASLAGSTVAGAEDKLPSGIAASISKSQQAKQPATTRTPTGMSPGAMGGRINVDEGKVDPGLAAAAARTTARNEETAGHQARYESQGYSPSAAASAARNKTAADENVRQQTGNSEAKAVTDSSGKNVTSGTNPDGSPRYVTSGGEVNNGGGDGGSDSRVICTELHSQGKLSEELYKMDMYYTKRNLSETTVRGYHYWAIPMVPLIRKNNLVCNISKYLAVKRAEEIAHIIDPVVYPKSTITGKLIKTVGEAICYGIGKFVKQKDYSVLYNGKSV